MKTMAYRVVRRVHVAVHTKVAPSDAEWRAYLDDIGQHLTALDAVYSMTHGGDLTASQRDEARKFWAGRKRKLPIAVVTPSTLVRVVASTLQFMVGGQIKPFAPKDTEAAFAYLGVGLEQQHNVRRAVAEMERDLGISP